MSNPSPGVPRPVTRYFARLRRAIGHEPLNVDLYRQWIIRDLGNVENPSTRILLVLNQLRALRSEHLDVATVDRLESLLTVEPHALETTILHTLAQLDGLVPAELCSDSARIRDFLQRLPSTQVALTFLRDALVLSREELAQLLTSADPAVRTWAQSALDSTRDDQNPPAGSY